VVRALDTGNVIQPFHQPIYWQLRIREWRFKSRYKFPSREISSGERLKNTPVSGDKGTSVLLRNVASVQTGTAPGEYDRYKHDADNHCNG